MALPTPVKEMFASTPVEKAFVRAEAMVKDKPFTTLAFGVAAGAAIGIFLPASRLLKLGLALYPIYQSYIEEQKKSKNIH